MTPAELYAARKTLGTMWGIGRPLTFAEMGKVLRLGGQRPDQSVRDYERGKTAISGPLSLALEALLSGWRPASLSEALPTVAEKAAEPPPKTKAPAPAAKVRKAVAEPPEAPRERMTMDDVRPKFVPRLKPDKPKR